MLEGQSRRPQSRNNTGKLWHLVKTLNEDVTTTRGTHAIEHMGSMRTGKQAANILSTGERNKKSTNQA